MLIPIKKIIVRDRIRKDFGDIEGLADSIKKYGLINNPVVNKDYVLLAGERRIRACKLLGWEQIPVNMMDTRDAEHELNIEISENDDRKEFSKAERVDYMRRLWRIEQAKAAERMNAGVKADEDPRQNSAEGGRADDKTAEQFGISRDTMKKEMQIVENKDLLTPEDFADWDEGRLSTNKAYQRIKAELDKVKREKEMAEGFVKTVKEQSKREALAEVKAELQSLRQTNKVLKEQASKAATVVAPEDYEQTKKQVEMLEADNERLSRERKDAIKELQDTKKTLEAVQSPDANQKVVDEAKDSFDNFAIATYNYIRRYGGFVWAFDKWADVPADTKRNFEKAVQALSAFSQQMVNNLGGLE